MTTLTNTELSNSTGLLVGSIYYLKQVTFLAKGGICFGGILGYLQGNLVNCLAKLNFSVLHDIPIFNDSNVNNKWTALQTQ